MRESLLSLIEKYLLGALREDLIVLRNEITEENLNAIILLSLREASYQYLKQKETRND